MYRILVVGAGYVGSAIAEHFVEKKQKVWALTRNAQKAKAFEVQGIQPILADLTKPETLKEIPPVQFIVLSAAPDERSDKAYREIYLQGIKNFLQAIPERYPPFLIVYLSSTGVWSRTLSGEVDENTLVETDTERARILLEAERQVLNFGYPSIIFRLSGIYGPDRNRMLSLKEGKWPRSQENHFMNMIHRDDIVSAMPVLFKSSEAGEIYLGVDDEPVAQSEFYAWLSEKLARSQDFDFQPPQGKKLLNQKLKSLGFQFQYPTFREGYLPLLNA